jgi:hypothetical protein
MTVPISIGKTPVYGFFETPLTFLKTVRKGHRQNDDI